MEGKMSVIIKRTDEAIGHSTNISTSLRNLQKTVGGYIETVTIPKEMLPDELDPDGDLVIICNEEGRLMDLPYNCTAFGYSFVGDIILIGMNGDDFDDVPIRFKDWKKYMEGRK